MKRYLITGGAGFIGANFVKYLYEVEENPQVVVLDKLTYSGNLDNLADVADREGFTFVKGDICDPEAVESVMDGVSAVVNFAAEVAVDRSLKDRKSVV